MSVSVFLAKVMKILSLPSVRVYNKPVCTLLDLIYTAGFVMYLITCIRQLLKYKLFTLRQVGHKP